uniref:EF-hand domain-containing protein n=2 Tax=Musa acuminata subsp. malaccensis TaxID=214687 RepID=A0A804KY72_MUSAM
MKNKDSLLITEDEIKHVTHEICSEDGELAAGIFGREGLPLFYHESVVNDTLLVHEAKDFNQQHLLEVDESFLAEFPYGSPPFNNEKLGIDQYGDAPVTDVIRPSDSPSPIVCELVEDEDISGDACHGIVLEEAEEEAEVLSKNEILFVIGQTHSDSNKFRLEEDEGTFDGSLAGESTSNGFTKWRSSAINRASETECLLSSSSRRSSSNWETLELFQKYDEEMTFLDRISSQKLAETESVRSIRFQPRSISERIARKFTIQKKKGGNRDPYQELEIAYVAQISLAWEALNWNYVCFQQRKANGDGERFYCTARIAQRFQQFQVLLQRFIENEPYQRDRRPQVFARTRISSPKLLQVPEFQEADEDGENIISPTEFSSILEDAIRTFMNFLKADKKNPRQILKSFVKTTSSSMKMGLKGLLRRRRCWNKKWVQGEEEEMDILMGLIDMKIVSRTLRMGEISQEQLQWCEEKMTKVGALEWKSSKRVLPASFFPLN